jgi:hypothetical protein
MPNLEPTNSNEIVVHENLVEEQQDNDEILEESEYFWHDSSDSDDE